MQLGPPERIKGSRKTILGCSRVCAGFSSVQKEAVDWERLPAVSCRLLHPARSLGCREPMLLLRCGCSQPAASWMLK